MYQGEKTIRKGDYTHHIKIAEQAIVDANYEPLRSARRLQGPPDENNG